MRIEKNVLAIRFQSVTGSTEIAWTFSDDETTKIRKDKAFILL